MQQSLQKLELTSTLSGDLLCEISCKPKKVERQVAKRKCYRLQSTSNLSRIKCGCNYVSLKFLTHRYMYIPGVPKKVHKFEIENLCPENRSISKVGFTC